MAATQAVDLVRLECELMKLLGNNNADVQSATTNLQSKYYDQPTVIPALMHFACSSAIDGLRKTSAVLLRQRSIKYWKFQSPQTQAEIKRHLLDRVQQEPIPDIRHSVAEVVDVVAQHEVRAGTWPELTSTLVGLCRSEHVGLREEGCFLMAALAESVLVRLRAHYGELFQLFAALLVDQGSLRVRVDTTVAVGHLAHHLDKRDAEAAEHIRQLIPLVCDVLVATIASRDEALITKAFEVFDDFTESKANILGPHMANLLELFRQISTNRDLEAHVRVKGMVYIQWAARYKRKLMKKTGHVAVLISSLIEILGEEEALAEDENDPEDPEDDRPARVAAQTLDTLALFLPPEDIMPHIFATVVAFMQQPDVRRRRAAMLVFTVVVEGCADYLRERVETIVPLLAAGLSDSEIGVRSTACLAVCEIAENVTELAKYHAQLLPLLGQVLTNSPPNVQETCCSALESFCESLGHNIGAYMADIMNALLGLVPTAPIAVQESIICAIGSVAHAAEQSFAPYFPNIISMFHAALGFTEEGQLELRAIATGTLGTIAQAIGKEAFTPHLDLFHRLAWQGLQTIDDPRLRECTWEFYAGLARTYQEDLAAIPDLLGPLVDALVTSALSNDGVAEQRSRENVPEFAQDPEDVGKADGFVVSTAYMNEKELAIGALGELALNVRQPFLPHIPRVMHVLDEVLEYFNPDVRVAVVTSYGQVGRAIHEIFVGRTPWEEDREQQPHAEVIRIGRLAIPRLLDRIPVDGDRTVVTEICHVINDMMRLCGPSFVPQASLQRLGELLLSLLKKEARCQNREEETDEGVGLGDEDGQTADEETEAELDALLIDATCDMLGGLAKTLGGMALPLVQSCYPFIRRYFKAGRSPSDRSMATGCLAEVVNGLKEHVAPLANRMLDDVFFLGLNDEEAEVQRNSAYAVGLICEHIGAPLHPFYPQILSRLQPLFSAGQSNGDGAPDQEEEEEARSVRENAAGAVSRMIIAGPMAVDINVAVALISRAMPIRDDVGEVDPVMRALVVLMDIQPQMFVSGAAYLLRTVAAMMLNPNLKRRAIESSIGCTKRLHALLEQAGVFAAAFASLSPDEQRVIQTALA